MWSYTLYEYYDIYDHDIYYVVESTDCIKVDFRILEAHRSLSVQTLALYIFVFITYSACDIVLFYNEAFYSEWLEFRYCIYSMTNSALWISFDSDVVNFRLVIIQNSSFGRCSAKPSMFELIIL